MKKLIVLIVFILGINIVLNAKDCIKATDFTTKISKINENPGKYHNKQVLIKGKVVNVFNLHWIGIKMYEVKDNSKKNENTILIHMKNTDVIPKEGDKIWVKGKVNQALHISFFGDKDLVIIEEKCKRIK